MGWNPSLLASIVVLVSFRHCPFFSYPFPWWKRGDDVGKLNTPRSVDLQMRQTGPGHRHMNLHCYYLAAYIPTAASSEYFNGQGPALNLSSNQVYWLY